MSLSNLTGNNRPVSNILSNFYTRRSNEIIKQEEYNSKNFEFGKNSIIIPKREFGRLKKDFGFFEAFIDTNFSNADQLFNKDGNYILKKEMFPEEMVHYNDDGKAYIIRRNEVWKALPKALSDYHVPDKNVADFLSNFLLFKTKNNSLFNPTIPEQETVRKANGRFIARPSRAQLKKQRRTQREINQLRRELGENNNNNNNNNYYHPYGYMPMSNQNLAKLLRREKREEEIAELKEKLRTSKIENVENLANMLENFYNNKQKIASTIHLTERATANRTKYGSKPGKLPGVLVTQRKQKRKEKRKTQKRKKQRGRKTLRQIPIKNNNEYNNENNYEY